MSADARPSATGDVPGHQGVPALRRVLRRLPPRPLHRRLLRPARRRQDPLGPPLRPTGTRSRPRLLEQRYDARRRHLARPRGLPHARLHPDVAITATPAWAPTVIDRAPSSAAPSTSSSTPHRGAADGLRSPRHSVVELLIVDEADRLKTAGAGAAARPLRPQPAIGRLVLIGMPGIEKRLARYPQLYSPRRLRPPLPAARAREELRFVLAHKWAELGPDPRPRRLHRRRGGGGDRAHHRRQLPAGPAPVRARSSASCRSTSLRTITKEVVEAARESLVIGAT